jgi:hypothetical protein
VAARSGRRLQDAGYTSDVWASWLELVGGGEGGGASPVLPGGGSVGWVVDSVGGDDGSALGVGVVVASLVVWSGVGVVVARVADGLAEGVGCSGR